MQVPSGAWLGMTGQLGRCSSPLSITVGQRMDLHHFVCFVMLSAHRRHAKRSEAPPDGNDYMLGAVFASGVAWRFPDTGTQ